MKSTIITALMFCATAAAAEPATSPAHLDVSLPFEQRWLTPYPGYPTTRVWRYRNGGDLHVHTTAAGVGDESAMLFYQPRGAKAGGEILTYDAALLQNEKQQDLTTYKGVTFWLRGDGGDGEISLGCDWNQTNRGYPRIGKFPLAGREWKKHFVPWDKFENPPGKNGFYYVNVRLMPATDRECWAVLSRMSLYKTEEIEAMTPPKVDDPPGLLPAERFVEPSVDEAAKLIPNTLAKLRARQPVTIVATGDSITAGAQLWYMNEDGRETYRAIYFGVLERALAAHYGYERHRSVFKMWVFPDKKKDPDAKQRFEIKTGETPAADGSLPFDGLQVIGVGAGGQDSRFGEAHLADVTQFRPDLVIWSYGANDALPKRVKEYREPTLRVIEALRKQGVEVILAVPTPWTEGRYYDHSLVFRDVAREIAATAKVPLVDQLGAFIARGERYRGDLLSDTIHPNEHGHEIMAATLASSLGVPEQFVWDRPLFRARAAGRKIPD